MAPNDSSTATSPGQVSPRALVLITIFLGLFSSSSLILGFISTERIASVLCLTSGFILGFFTLFLLASIIQERRFPSRALAETDRSQSEDPTLRR